MATFITIVDTIKDGWLTASTNAMYQNGVKTKEINIKKSSINAIDIEYDDVCGEYVEIHTDSNGVAFNITNDTTVIRFYPIESVNGVIPTSAGHLKQLIFNLL